MPPTFADEDTEQLYFRAVEPYRNDKAYTLTIIVPNATTRSAWLEIDRAGDFALYGIVGGAQGPVTSAGVRDLSGQATTFPAPGVTRTAGFAERGLTVRIVDEGMGGRTYTQLRNILNSQATVLNQFTPLENILSPGYGFGYYFRPQSFRAFLPMGSLWRFDFTNLDTSAGGYHRADIVLLGRRFTNVA